MKLDELRPENDYTRTLWGACLLIQEGRQRPAGYNGERWSLQRPEGAPVRYKGRKISGMIISIDGAETVTGIELHYGPILADGYAVRMDPETLQLDNVTSFYRRERK